MRGTAGDDGDGPAEPAADGVREQAEDVGGVVRLERDRGHEWVPRLIEAAPGLIDSISVGKPTLEDVFIRLTGRRFVAADEPAPPDPKITAAIGKPVASDFFEPQNWMAI